MGQVPLLGPYLTATVPDGSVNRAVQVTLHLDTDTGEVKGVYDIDAARQLAVGPDGQLPRNQRRKRRAPAPDVLVPGFGDGDRDEDQDDDEDGPAEGVAL